MKRSATLMISSLAIASLFAFAACGKKDEAKSDDKAGASADDQSGDQAAAKPVESDQPAGGGGELGNLSKEEMGEKMIALMTKMGDVAEANAEDCDKLADELAKVVEEGKPLMEAGKKFDDDPEAKAWFDENYGPKLEPIMAKMLAPMMSCQDNEKLQKVFEDFAGDK